MPKISKTEIVDYRDIVTEIGDYMQSSFYPQLKCKGWDNEFNLSLRLDTTIIGAVSELAAVDKVRFVNSVCNCFWYPHSKDAFEFEIWITKKVSETYFDFSIESKGVQVWHQPELTAKEITDGAYRPDNVVNSYAIYASKRNNEYRNGKLCHIYAVYAQDAKGNREKLFMEHNGSFFRMYLPTAMINLGNFPIVIDPTFGYTTVPGTGTTIEQRIIGDQAMMGGVAGTGNSITVYINKTSDSTHKAKCNIYADSADEPASPIANGETEEITFSTDFTGWQTFNFTTAPSLSSSTNYWLACWGSTATYILQMFYDIVSGARARGDPAVYGTWPDPFAATDIWNSRDFGIYCDYSTGGTEVTKNYDFKAVVKSSVTNQYDFKAVVKDDVTKNYDFKGVVKDTVTKNYDFKSVIKDDVTKNYDFKAIVKDSVTKNYDLKAVISNISLKNYDLKAIVKDTVTKNYDFKAVVKDSITKNYDFKAVVTAGNDATNQYDFKAIVKDTVTKNYDFKTVVKDDVTKNYDFKAVIANVKLTNYDFKTIIKDSLTKNYDFKAIVKDDVTKNYDLKVKIFNLATKNYDFKAIVKDDVTKNYDFKAVIKDSVTKNYDFKSVISSGTTTSTNNYDFKARIVRSIITVIQDEIVTQLGNVTDLKHVGLYAGDFEDILQEKFLTPAALVVYSSAEYQDKHVVGNNNVRIDRTYDVYLIEKDLYEKTRGASDIYLAIEDVETNLVGYETTDGYLLWPVSQELVFSRDGVLIYKLDFRCETEKEI